MVPQLTGLPRAGITILAGVGLLTLALSGCGGTASPEASATTAAPTSTLSSTSATGANSNWSAAAPARPRYCSSRAPAGAADEWTTLQPDAAAGTVSTFDAVSQTTRACAYDRPGTTVDSGERTTSTTVPQPTTASRSADDLHALMEATDQGGPYVVVGLSWGGMIAQQFARRYSDEVVGLVLLDSASEYLQTTFSAEQWSTWMEVVANSLDSTSSEVPSYEPSIVELRATPELPAMPTVVVSSDQPWDLQVTPGESTWPGWVAAQAELARALDAKHITDTDSGHGIPVEQPALVTEAVLDVVSAAR